MPAIDFVVETDVSRSVRARQLEALFDVPPQDKCAIHYQADLPLEERPWQVGAIIGPSGCGKSTILRHLWGDQPELEWKGKSVLDDFPEGLSIAAISEVCQSVGFNTIPTWLRPYHVLSNGEKFRVDMARRLLEFETVVLDEFTSVVDRQVAKIGSHAFQKYIRRNGRQAVVASCHYDIEEWLQPDWIFEPATMTFRWRCLQRRPAVDIEIVRVGRKEWRRFAPFHYMSADLNHSATLFCALVNGTPAALAAMLYRPHPKVKDIYGCSRLVTLPDFQGLGVAHALIDKVGAMYRDLRRRTRTYPAHPALIRSFAKSPAWRQVAEARMKGTNRASGSSSTGKMGGRPNAVFEYIGPAFGDRAFSASLISGR